MAARLILAILASALMMSPMAASSQHYAETNGWHFRNFVTDPLTWEQYRDTFLGIPPTRDPISSAFDVLFYDHLYSRELSSSGNCYGMALQSLLMIKKGGNLGYCLPVSQYSGDLIGTLPGGDTAGPTDPALTRVINQLHGHQVNTETLRFFLDLIASGKTRDGNFAYDQVQYYQLREDPTLVSITKSTNPADGGHTMVAYDARIVGGNKRIFVYDPNRPWPLNQAHYQADDNVITVAANGDWSFTMSGGTSWTGGPSGGGHIVIAPISVTGPHGRVPTSLGIDAASAITTLFVFAEDGELQQVTNTEGKRLYRPGTQELDTDEATGMRNILPWFPSDAVDDEERPRLPFSTYFIFGELGSALTLTVHNKKEEYGLRVIGSRGSVEILGKGSPGTDRLTVANAGWGPPSVVFGGAAERTYDVLITREVQPGERVRQYSITGMRLPKNAKVEFSVADNLNGVEVTSFGARASYELRFFKRTLYSDESLQMRQVAIKSGESQLLEPDSWIDLRWARVLQRSRTKQLDSKDPTVRQ